MKEISERLSRIIADIERMLGQPSAIVEHGTADSLASFGLTFKEAEAWLQHERGFPRDIRDRRDDKLTEDGSNYAGKGEPLCVTQSHLFVNLAESE